MLEREIVGFARNCWITFCSGATEVPKARQMKVLQHAPPSRPHTMNPQEVFRSWVGAFIGISAVAGLNDLCQDQTDCLMLIGSFGASAVLVYGAIHSPLAQPRNLLGGHVLSALVGVAAYQLVPHFPSLAAALAVASAIAAMHLTATLHPPGGATALIAVIGGDRIHEMGYLYALAPVGVGAVILLVVALIVNNVPRGRRYPLYWY